MNALRAGDPALLGAALDNDLQEAALALQPQLRRTLDAGRELGAIGAMVSGSGPTCAFLARSESAAIELSASLSAGGCLPRRTSGRRAGPGRPRHRLTAQPPGRVRTAVRRRVVVRTRSRSAAASGARCSAGSSARIRRSAVHQIRHRRVDGLLTGLGEPDQHDPPVARVVLPGHQVPAPSRSSRLVIVPEVTIVSRIN